MPQQSVHVRPKALTLMPCACNPSSYVRFAGSVRITRRWRQRMNNMMSNTVKGPHPEGHRPKCCSWSGRTLMDLSKLSVKMWLCSGSCAMWLTLLVWPRSSPTFLPDVPCTVQSANRHTWCACPACANPNKGFPQTQLLRAQRQQWHGAARSQGCARTGLHASNWQCTDLTQLAPSQMKSHSHARQ